MPNCTSCGSPIPDGQGPSCSMCYGDIDHGRDGYYRKWAEQQERKNGGDAVCEHGTALDVHCCNCHSGFLFDIDSCVCVFNPREKDEDDGQTYGHPADHLAERRGR